MKGYCADCGEVVGDEECPHWDYEFDPRVKIEAGGLYPLPFNNNEPRGYLQ